MLLFFGGSSGNRTPDTLIKSQVLYQLSYRGASIKPLYHITSVPVCQEVFEKNYTCKKGNFNRPFEYIVFQMGQINVCRADISEASER